jgi:hypothetical protein
MMKLSDVKGDRVLDVLADLIAPVTNIAIDDKAAAIFKKAVVPEEEKKNTVIKRLKENLPALIKGHKADLIEIMCIISGQSKKEYVENLSLASFTKDLIDLITDQEFQRLF